MGVCMCMERATDHTTVADNGPRVQRSRTRALHPPAARETSQGRGTVPGAGGPSSGEGRGAEGEEGEPGGQRGLSPGPRRRTGVRGGQEAPDTRRGRYLLPVGLFAFLALLPRVPQPDVAALEVTGMPAPAPAAFGSPRGGGGRPGAPSSSAAPVPAVLEAHPPPLRSPHAVGHRERSTLKKPAAAPGGTGSRPSLSLSSLPFHLPTPPRALVCRCGRHQHVPRRAGGRRARALLAQT